MHTAGHQLVIVTFLIMIFVGQAMAAVNLPCAMVAAESSDMPSRLAMHHSPDTSPGNNTSSTDSCGDPLCSMDHCIGCSTIGVSGSQFGLYGTAVLNRRPASSYLSPDSLSLFRPPISR